MKNRDTRHFLSAVILPVLLLPVWTLTQVAPLLQDSTTCDSLRQDGVILYRQALYSEALQKFQAALVCYQEMGDWAGRGVTLNNIGLVHHRQGRYTEALEHYLQALAIYREVDNRTQEGTTINNIGGVYHCQGRHAEALEMYQQALGIRREVGDRAGEGNTLSNIGGVYYEQRRYTQALESFRQALSIEREVGDRTEEGNILNNIGLVHDAQGRYTEALEMYQQALAVHREVGDRAGEGVTLSNIGTVYRDQGRYTEALEMYQQALVIHQEVGDRAGEGVTLSNIGTVYHDRGRFAEALETYRRALTIRRQISDRVGEGVTLGNIGLIHQAQGRYAEAMDVYQQALVIAREVGDRAGQGTALNNIGLVFQAQARYAEALRMYQEALAVAQEVGNRAWEGAALNNIATVYDTLGRYDEALETYQQSLSIHQDVGTRAEEGNTLNNIGFAYHTQGRYTEALTKYHLALSIRREVGDRVGEGTTLNNIGGVYHDQGRYAEALEMYQQALAIAQGVGDRAGEGNALKNIGAVYRDQGRYVEAIIAYQQAVDTLEAIRVTAGSEQGRSSFIAQYADLYTRAAGLFHQLGQDEEAFFTSERGRARSFLDSLATGHVELTDDEAAALLVHEQEAYAFRQSAQEALARAHALDPPDPALVADLEVQLAEAEAAYAQALTAIEARSDQLAALVPGRSMVLGLSDVQALLDGQTTLLSYFVLDDQTLAFLITPSSLDVILLDVSRQELAERISYFRGVIPFRQPEATQPAARELYQLLVAPLIPWLHTPRLAVVPHGPLHYLPFAALVAPDTGQTLIERYTLIALPSASALPFIQQNRSSPARADGTSDEPVGGAALILGNPATRDPDLEPLIFAEREAQAIATLYDAQPLLGEAATESAVREGAPRADILHLAAHGGYNPHYSLYSAITLAPDAENDGRLEVHEIYGLDLVKADLVVLSACQTQLGELGAGDELVGLTRAFLFAGAPTVVATLWSVDDEATGLLMERFYTHLGEGMDKAAALRQAQLEVREAYPEPYYWAGFVLSGDGGIGAAGQEGQEKVSPPYHRTPATSSRWIWLIVAGGLLIVVVIGGVIWRRRL